MMNWFFGFLMFACQRIVVNSQVWPEGTYGLPKPMSGCTPSWQEGWREQDLENSSPNSEFSIDLKLRMEATLTGGDIRRSFCVKTSTQIGETPWPAGSYCVYKKYQCPSGMKSGQIKWDDEDTANTNNFGGTLPDGSFNHDTILKYCCQDQGLWTNSIQLPVDKPFYLLPYNSKSCQRVRGAISTLDYIIFDTEDENNHDTFTLSHVFTNKDKSLPKIYYCYYEGCQHKLQKESGTISTTTFPDYQYCSWSIIVQQGYTVSLTLTSINIPGCDGNYMNIYDGVDDVAPIIMSLCGKNATSGIRLRSTGNNVFITLKSGQNSQNGENMQFHANFTTTASFSGLSWPSGTYGLPKTATSCPEKWIPGWRKQIMEDDQETSETYLSPDLRVHMDVSLVGYALTRHFCTKTIDDGGSQITWPNGNYCIYKKNQCPSNMKDGFITLDDEDFPNNGGNSLHSILPDGDFGPTGNDHKTKIFYCCNDQGDWKQSIELPIHESFYLLPYEFNHCQRVKEALSTLEKITYDTEQDNNFDVFHGSHAYTDKLKNKPTISYCYYKGCDYKFENDTGNFGADRYPEYQHCSWSITVKHGLEVFLEFTSMDIPDCLENQLEIYDGVDNTGSLLATYCADNATSGNTLRSPGNNVYVLLKSGNSNGGSVQFHVRYGAEEPITEPAWPSGTYGLPKTTDACPAGWVQGSRRQDLENDGVFKSAFSTLFHMDAVLGQTGRYIERKFCMKTFSDGKNKLWPPGSYCIYKKNTCPTGMADGYIYWDDEDSSNANGKMGILPEGTYDTNTEIYFCCRDERNWYDPIELPVSVPIFLLPYNSKNCQRVKWAMSKQEYITYDTENDQNGDMFYERHVYAENKGKNLPTTIYYCYYEGCQYKIDAEMSSYISVSTASNQDFQHCSWLLSARYGNITLTFNSMSVPDCSSGNFIEVYDGSNNKSVSLARYCGNPTISRSITSTGKHLFMLVKSGNNRQMGITVNFRATFKNNLPVGFTVPPSTEGLNTGKTTMKSSTILATTLPTTLSTTLASRSSTTSAKTSSTTSSTTAATTLSTTSETATSPTTLLQTQSTTSLIVTTLQKEQSTSKRMSSTAPIEVSTLPDKTTRENEKERTVKIEKPTELVVTAMNTDENVQPTTKTGIESGDKSKSSGSDNSSTALAIVIPLCVTFLVTVLIVMFFYRRRQTKNTPAHGSTDGGNELSTPDFNARFQYPDKVSISGSKGAERVDISGNEKDNPLYESGENHTYCSIDDVQDQYKKQIGLSSTKPSQSTLYETPVDPAGASTSTNQNPYHTLPLTATNPSKLNPEHNDYETPADPAASTSSFNPLYTSTNPYQVSNIQSPTSESLAQPPKQNDTPTSSTTASTTSNTPEAYYKTPNNPYDTMLPKKETQAAYDVSPMNSHNHPPRASYENVPNTNNVSPYQTPSCPPDAGFYEVMTGRNPQVNLEGNTGTTQC